MRCSGLVLGAVALLWQPPVATADDEVEADDTGYIGGPTLTPEIDGCEPRTGIELVELQARAGEHYERGLTLYVQGDYEGAIEEFVAGYCDTPNAEMLKNIAQSFDRLVDYEKSVAYLSRYILEMPKDDIELREQMSYRVEVLSNLPARVRVATVPPGARITLAGDTGVNARGFSDDKEAMLVRKGDYELRVELEGYEPIVQRIEVKIGQPYSYYFRLEPKTGTVRVVADPSSSRIFIDKRLVGIGTYAERLPLGAHTITIEADDRSPATRTVEISDGRTTNVTIKLDKPPRSGRKELLIGSSITGAIFGSAAFASIFGSDSPLAPLGFLVGLGVGFGGGYWGIPKDVTVGRSSYIIGSTLIGAAEGATVAEFLACDQDQSLDESEDDSCLSIVGGATVAAGIGGLLVGAITADRANLDAGDAALVNSGAQWGTIGGLLFYAAFEGDRRLLSPLAFAGLNLGTISGALLAKRLEVSRGHVALIDVAGLAGMVAGVALVDVVEPGQRSERLPHFALLGMTAGLITGAYLTRNMDEPRSIPLKSLEPSVGTASNLDGSRTPTWGLAGIF